MYRSNSAFFSLSKLLSSIIFLFLFSVSLSHLFLYPKALSFYFSICTEKSSRHSVSEDMVSSMDMTLVMNYMDRLLRWSDSLNFSGSRTRMLFYSSKAMESLSVIEMIQTNLKFMRVIHSIVKQLRKIHNHNTII